jgi:glycerol-3-phosphate cytidylyltransferase
MAQRWKSAINETNALRRYLAIREEGDHGMMKKREGEVGITFGCFDLGPHAGHLELFRHAKDRCAHLVVGLHVNPKLERDSKRVPIPSVSERYLALYACRWVDEVIPYEFESEIPELIYLIRPSIRFMGSDYINQPFTGKEACEKVDCAIDYIDRYHGVSSSGMRKKVLGYTPIDFDNL